jgi:NADPH:quinone reductase-like Zn-dependent oxidoreductase
VPVPNPGPGEALVKVAACGFNVSDIGFRAGFLRKIRPVELPFTLGAEAAGTIVATGEDAGHAETGDAVVGWVDRGGAAAQYVIARAATLVRAPAAIPLAHAAGVPVAGITAWQALFEHATVTPGTRILIYGASGGVGMFAVQLAVHAGASVIATASPRSAERVRGYGAEQLIDYTIAAPHDVLDRPVDLVLNLVPLKPETAPMLCGVIRPGGTLVSVTGPVEPPVGMRVTTRHFLARNDPKQLAELLALVENGALRVDITATRPLADLPAVHRDAEAGRLSGKVILVPG